MKAFLVEFYENKNGDRPAEDFLNSLDVKMRSKLLMILKVLQKKGNMLRALYIHFANAVEKIKIKIFYLAFFKLFFKNFLGVCNVFLTKAGELACKIKAFTRVLA